MNTLFLKCSDRSRIIEYTLPDEARQEMIRLLDDGYISQYEYQLYLGYLMNGYHSVIIDGQPVFETTVAALVET